MYSPCRIFCYLWRNERYITHESGWVPTEYFILFRKDLTPPALSPLSYRKLEECRHLLSDNWDKDLAACRLSPGQPAAPAACSCCLFPLLLQPHHRSCWQAAVPSDKPWCHPNCRFLLSNTVMSICYESRTDRWVINSVILFAVRDWLAGCHNYQSARPRLRACGWIHLSFLSPGIKFGSLGVSLEFQLSGTNVVKNHLWHQPWVSPDLTVFLRPRMLLIIT